MPEYRRRSSRAETTKSGYSHTYIYVKEWPIEQSGILLQQIRLGDDIGGAMVLAIFVVEGSQPQTIFGNIAKYVSRVLQKLPEL